MAEQYSPAVPQAERKDGYLYDANSGVLLGLASDELKARQPAMVPFTMNLSGCPHKVVIHKVV